MVWLQIPCWKLIAITWLVVIYHHRILRDGLQKSLPTSPAPLQSTRTPQLDQVAQGLIQPCLESLQGWGINHITGQLVPAPYHPHCERIHLISNLNLPSLRHFPLFCHHRPCWRDCPLLPCRSPVDIERLLSGHLKIPCWFSFKFGYFNDWYYFTIGFLLYVHHRQLTVFKPCFKQLAVVNPVLHSSALVCEGNSTIFMCKSLHFPFLICNGWPPR